MISFRRLELKDRDWINARLRESDFRNCDYSFGNMYIWQEVYHVCFADLFGCYCTIGWDEEHPGMIEYNFPAGNGDRKAAVEAMVQDARERGIPFRLRGMNEECAAWMKETFPGRFEYFNHRDYNDYIYTTEKLANLSGRKLHGKRNHIARFKERDWSYEPLTRENLKDAFLMNDQWHRIYGGPENPGIEMEATAVDRAFEHFFELGFQGGLLRSEGRVVAYTIGEPLNSDTFVVHIEKAFSDVQGAYPMINQQFVRNACQDFTYVNREEDMGDEGLRKAKLSYYPDILLEKYMAAEPGVGPV